jgi:hypothetical protein
VKNIKLEEGNLSNTSINNTLGYKYLREYFSILKKTLGRSVKSLKQLTNKSTMSRPCKPNASAVKVPVARWSLQPAQASSNQRLGCAQP